MVLVLVLLPALAEVLGRQGPRAMAHGRDHGLAVSL